MSDNKKAPAKKPAAKKSEGKATASKATTAPAAKPVPSAKPVKPKAPVKAKAPAKKAGRPRVNPIKPEGKKLKAQSRSIKPVTPDLSPPSEDVIAEALEFISPKEMQFVEVFMTCMNGTQAWMAVYGTEKPASAAAQASECLRKPKVKEYLSKRMKQAFERTEEAQDKLIQMYTFLAYGDANELVEYRRESCRYCHGIDHKYQHTPNEQENRREAYDNKVADETAKAKREGEEPPMFEPFDELGGVGFNPKLDPHPECPECFGDGIGHVHFKDTRTLSPAALALYAGAKVGKEGIEIKMASKEKAAEMLAKILKLTEDKTEVNLIFDQAELEAKYASKMLAAHERMAAITKSRGITEG